MAKTGVSSLILIILFTAVSFASEKNTHSPKTLAVFDLAAIGVDKKLSRQVAESLRKEFGALKKYKVLNRTDMNKTAVEKNLKITACSSEACASGMGRALGADSVAIGSLNLKGRAYHIRLAIINAETGQTGYTYEYRCECSVDELLKSTKKIARRLLDDAPGTYDEPPKVVKVWLVMKSGARMEMVFNGFNTKCGGYKEEGIRYETKVKAIDLRWEDIKYVIPEPGKGALRNENDFEAASLKPERCKDAAITEKRVRKIDVQGHEKEVHEEVRVGIDDIRIIAFSPEWLEEAIKKEQEEADALAGEFVFVNGGCYQMGDMFGDGDSDERPAHEACVNDFYIGKYEVTQGRWKAVMGNNPSYFKNCGDNCPIEQVSWNDAQEFVRRLNQKSGTDKFRLPTEAEWEYAARSGGKNEKYSGGGDIDSVAWYLSNSGNKTYPVGMKLPNGLGIYDMTGNVLEWCQDWYGENYYSESLRNNPTGPGTGQSRVLRGGSWGFNMRTSRTTFRHWYLPTYGYYVGLRIVKSAD